MSTLQTRLTKIETGIDVTKLASEQIRLLDVSKLTREQWAALDVDLLTEQQIMQIGLENLTDAQLSQLHATLSAEQARWLESLSDDELTAVAEGRFELWVPGYRPESNA